MRFYNKISNNGKDKFAESIICKRSLGSIRVTVHSTGNIVSSDDYDRACPPIFLAEGMQLEGRSANYGSANEKYKFLSKEHDAETGYDWLDARGYDARIGRFLTVDPLAIMNPEYSPYHYAYNNPLRFIDPSGLSPEGDEPPEGTGPGGIHIIPGPTSYGNNNGTDYRFLLTAYSVPAVSTNGNMVKNDNNNIPMLNIIGSSVIALDNLGGALDLNRRILKEIEATKNAAKICGKISRSLKRLGAPAAAFTIGFKVNAYYNNQISGARLTYNLTAIAISYSVGILNPGAGLVVGYGLEYAPDAFDYMIEIGVKFDTDMRNAIYANPSNPFNLPY